MQRFVQILQIVLQGASNIAGVGRKYVVIILYILRQDDEHSSADEEQDEEGTDHVRLEVNVHHVPILTTHNMHVCHSSMKFN